MIESILRMVTFAWSYDLDMKYEMLKQVTCQNIISFSHAATKTVSMSF